MQFHYYLKKFPLRILLLAGLFVTALILFGYIVHEVLHENEQGFDNWVFHFFKEHIISGDLTPVMRVITFFASAPFQLVFYPALMLGFYFKGQRTTMLDIATIAISGVGIIFLLKAVFHRARPSNPLIDPLRSYSFPSGHASSGFILYGLLAYLILKSTLQPAIKYCLVALCILFSMAIGVSRIYLRVHYTSDVLAGFCIGFAWLALSIYILNRIKKKPDLKSQGQP